MVLQTTTVGLYNFHWNSVYNGKIYSPTTILHTFFIFPIPALLVFPYLITFMFDEECYLLISSLCKLFTFLLSVPGPNFILNTFALLVKKSSTFHGTQKFITAVTSDNGDTWQLKLFSGRWILSTYFHLILRPILILSFNVHFDLLVLLFSFPIQNFILISELTYFVIQLHSYFLSFYVPNMWWKVLTVKNGIISSVATSFLLDSNILIKYSKCSSVFESPQSAENLKSVLSNGSKWVGNFLPATWWWKYNPYPKSMI